MKRLLSAVFVFLLGAQPVHSANPAVIHNLQLPVSGEWQVFWGGDTQAQNAHGAIPAQRYALDMVISTDKQGYDTYKNEGKKNSDYYCWNKPIYAAHAGRVVVVVDGVPDNTPGEMNRQMVYGNTVMVQHPNGMVSVYAHLRLGTPTVKVGATVKAGQEIGRCGNSGNSSEPHLHFHVQTQAGFEKGLGVKAYFKDVVVNGKPMPTYAPVKNDKIRKKN